MYRHHDFIQDVKGNAVPGCAVTVRDSNDHGAAVQLFDSNDGSTGISNPRHTGAQGEFSFYIADGTYDLLIEGDMIAPYEVLEIPMCDQTPFVRDVTSPRFGAIGDGVADDTAALSAALALGGDVFLPVGLYLVTSPLAVPSGTHIRGAGVGVSTVWMATNNETVFAINADALSVEISGIGIMGDYSDPAPAGVSGRAAIHGASSNSNVNIHDVKLYGLSTCGIFANTPEYWNIANVLIDNVWEHGICLLGAVGAGGHDVTITNCQATNVGAIGTEDGVAGLKIARCEYANVSNSSFNAEGSGAYSYGVFIGNESGNPLDTKTILLSNVTGRGNMGDVGSAGLKMFENAAAVDVVGGLYTGYFGVYMYGPTLPPEYIHLDGVNTYGYAGAACHITDGENIFINGGIFKTADGGTGLYLDNAQSGLVSIGGTVLDNGATGTPIFPNNSTVGSNPPQVRNVVDLTGNLPECLVHSANDHINVINEFHLLKASLSGDLETINGGYEGMEVTLIAWPAQMVTVKQAVDNIHLDGGSGDKILVGNNGDTIKLVKSGANWYEISRSAN